MVASFLQDDLAEELKIILKDFKLRDPDGNLRGVNIYSQVLPIPQAIDQGEIPIEQLENGLVDEQTQEDPYPYVIVRISEGEIENPMSKQSVTTMLLFGVYDNNYENSGHKDILNMIQKIYERFAKYPLLAGKYTISFPIAWAMQEEESYPYYFGGMELKWETASIRREDEYA